MRREEKAQKAELIEIDEQTILQIYTEGDVSGLLDDVKKKVFEATPDNPDLSDKKTQDIFRSNASSIARAKTKFDNAGKELVTGWKAKSKKVDGVRKYFRDSMDYFKVEYREPLTQIEEEEKKREQELIFLEQLEIEWNEAIDHNSFIDREREVARKEAEFAKREEERKAREENERLEKERIEREDRLKKEAIEKVKIDAERSKKEAEEKIKQVKQEKIEAAQKAENDKKEAVEAEKRKAKEEADRIESERIEKERIESERIEMERIAAEKKAANRNHQKKINREALEDINKVLSGKAFDDKLDIGKVLITAIAKNEIRNIAINY